MTSETCSWMAMYGIVIVTVTFVALFTKGWSKTAVIGLIILWIPFLIFCVLVELSFASVTCKLSGDSLLRYFAVGLITAGPIILIGVVFFLAWRLLNRFRD